MAQYKAVSDKRSKYLASWEGRGLIGLVARTVYRMYNFFFDYSPYLLPVLIIAFKLAEWWYSMDNGTSSAKPVPPPPQPPFRHSTNFTHTTTPPHTARPAVAPTTIARSQLASRIPGRPRRRSSPPRPATTMPGTPQQLRRPHRRFCLLQREHHELVHALL